jgi:hypothetical protein
VAKLIKILAASVGGGLILGAGIRLGEAIATWDPAVGGAEGQLDERLKKLENRLDKIEVQSPEALRSDVESQSHAVRIIRSELSRESRNVESLNEAGTQLRDELHVFLEQSVITRMQDIESRLKAEAERHRQEMLEAVVEGVQTRVISRISDLEDEVAGQSAALSELRECSLRTERSIQKLLGGLDKLIVNNPTEPRPAARESQASPPPPNPPAEPTTPPASTPVPPSLAQLDEPTHRKSRWGIFG